ncbi:MAG TPA: antibiotic biosynthesis monooxygenase family protein [Actinospica sp.]|nr:antibiotic biosynthesis monooxygenase family protein [Actinospica sp.]
MIARMMSCTTQPGRGKELADLMHRIAESLRGFPGCELYVITRAAEDPDRVCVFEVWQDEESAQAALSAPPDGSLPSPGDVMALLAEPPNRLDLEVVGGVGLPPTIA